MSLGDGLKFMAVKILRRPHYSHSNAQLGSKFAKKGKILDLSGYHKSTSFLDEGNHIEPLEGAESR
jgi:hypothetical protein